MTNNTSTKRSKRFPRLRTIAGGVVFAAALVVTLGATPGRDNANEPVVTPVDQSAVAAWANANGLHGFSPTNLSAVGDNPTMTSIDEPAFDSSDGNSHNIAPLGQTPAASPLTTDLGSLGLQTKLYDPYPMQVDDVGVIPRSNFGSDIDWIEANGW